MEGRTKIWETWKDESTVLIRTPSTCEETRDRIRS